MVNFFVLIKTVILLLLITLPSCKKNNESTLVIADITKIDEETTADSINISVIGCLLFSTLTYVDSNIVAHNLVAEEIRLFPGGKAIEIRIKKGIRFHDGRELTESDVAASISRIMDTDKYMKERYGQIKVAIAGKLKVTVTGDKLLSDVDTVLSPNIYISSKAFIGTGPYKVHRWIDNGVELTANNDYFERTPKLKKVVYRYEPDERKRVNMLLKGEADLLAWLSPQMAEFLKRDGRFYVEEWPSVYYSALFFNNESPLFRDKAIRRAVSMAIDRDGHVKKVLKGGGIKTSTPLPPQIINPENNKADTDYRPGDAVRLLNGAGWRDADGDGILEKDGRELRFRLHYNVNTEEFRKIADLISRDLFEVGIGVEAVPADINESTGRNFEVGSYDAILETKSSYDKSSLVTWSSSSLFNISRFNSAEMDTLLERLRYAMDIGQKKEVYARMQQIFEEDVPAVFLYNPAIFTAVNKRFKGAEDFVGNIYSVYKIKDWSINEGFR